MTSEADFARVLVICTICCLPWSQARLVDGTRNPLTDALIRRDWPMALAIVQDCMCDDRWVPSTVIRH